MKIDPIAERISHVSPVPPNVNNSSRSKGKPTDRSGQEAATTVTISSEAHAQATKIPDVSPVTAASTKNALQGPPKNAADLSEFDKVQQAKLAKTTEHQATDEQLKRTVKRLSSNTVG